MSLIEPNNFCKNNNIVSEAQRKKIIQYLKFIFNYITKICKLHFENINKNILDIIKESDLSSLKEINEKPLHIMKIASFDNINDFYLFVISVFKHNIINIQGLSSFKIKDYIYKDLIDICTLMNIIIDRDEKTIEDNIIKFYAFHLINVFSECKDKIEISKIFFKMGQVTIMDKYQIKDFDKFFPIDIKMQQYKEFLKNVENLIIKCQNIYNNDIKSHPENIEDNFPVNIKEIKEKIKSQMVKLEQTNQIPIPPIIRNILNKLWNLLTSVDSIKQFVPYRKLIMPILTELDDMNEFDISYSLCFIDINTQRKSLTQREKEYKALKEDYYEDNYNKFALYLLKFRKYSKIKSILINGGNLSLTKEFKEILVDTEFQNKIIKFFKSNSVMRFLESKLEKKITCQINKESYDDFLKLLNDRNFWDSIMFFTLPKNIKGFVCSYMRIVINDNFIIFHKVENKEQKRELLKFFLFELIIHELMHFLRRYFLLGTETLKAITPPGSEESKKNKSTGEIGESFIKYVFGFKRITSITLEQAKLFSKLSFEDEKDIDELKKIISLEPSFDKESSIYIKFQDSNPDLERVTYAKMEGGCLYSFRGIGDYK